MTPIQAMYLKLARDKIQETTARLAERRARRDGARRAALAAQIHGTGAAWDAAHQEELLARRAFESALRSRRRAAAALTAIQEEIAAPVSSALSAL